MDGYDAHRETERGVWTLFLIPIVIVFVNLIANQLSQYPIYFLALLIFPIFIWSYMQKLIFHIYILIRHGRQTYCFRERISFPFDFSHQHNIVLDNLTQNSQIDAAHILYALKDTYDIGNYTRYPIQLLELTRFPLLFHSKSDVMRIFILSFFALNILFFISTIPIIRYFSDNRYPIQFSLISVIILFALFIYQFIRSFPPKSSLQYSNELQYHIDDLSSDFLIFRYISIGIIEPITFERLREEIKESHEQFNTFLTNTLQIAIPMFFLAYITLIIHFYH